MISSFSRCSGATPSIVRVEARSARASAMSAPLPKGQLGHLGPLPERGLRLGQETRAGHPAARSGPGRSRWAGGRRTGARECRARSRSKSGGGVDGRSTPASGRLHAHRVPGEEDAGGRVVQSDVVLGVARASRRPPAPGPGRPGSPRRRPGRGGARPGSARVARRGSRAAARRRGRPSSTSRGRVGQVAGSLLVHVDGGPGEGAGHVADPAGVVEVDVGDDHSGQVVRARARARRAASRSTGTEDWLPVSTRTGASPSTR